MPENPTPTPGNTDTITDGKATIATKIPILKNTKQATKQKTSVSFANATATLTEVKVDSITDLTVTDFVYSSGELSLTKQFDKVTKGATNKITGKFTLTANKGYTYFGM